MMAATAPAMRPAANGAAGAVSDGLAALDRHGARVALKRGETLFYEGDPTDAYYKVVSGTLRGCKLLADGRRQIGQFFLAGDLFGLGHNGLYLFSAEAITDVALLRFPRAQVERLVRAEPALGRSLIAVAGRHLVAAQQQMLLLGRKTAEERIASFLLMMAARAGRDRFALPMSRADIADYLGLTIETVSRTFTLLRQNGLIALHGTSEVAIPDRAALEAIAEGG